MALKPGEEVGWIRDVIFLLVSSLSPYIGYQINWPTSNKAGFYIGAFASQLHLPILLVHGGLVAFLRGVLYPNSGSAASIVSALTTVRSPYALPLGILLSVLGYLLVLKDLIHGFTVQVPRIKFPHLAKAGRPLQLSLQEKAKRIVFATVPLLSFIYYRVFRTNVYRNIVYAKLPNADLTLDVYVPKVHLQSENEKRTLLPVCLYVHGGAWMHGSKDVVGLFVVQEVASLGKWICVTINYRKSNLKGTGAKFPDHISDVKRAIVWVKEHIQEYGGDPSLICVCGGSAGGHLASLAALTPNFADFQPGFEHKDTSVQACINIYGVSDFADQRGQWKAWDYYHGKAHPDPSKRSIMISFLQKALFDVKFHEEPEQYLNASPVYHGTKRANVPFLIVHGNKDIVVPLCESQFLLEALDPSHTTLFEVDGGHHGFDSFPNPRGYALLDFIRLWLEEVRVHLKHVPTPHSSTSKL